ncbi:flagellar basal body L-ring protein FlgH, partial [Pseudomonas aeruginosa]|nr:flagellar basal body L-ring protein FlgH [Pseudomonas aeruginosa]
MNRLMIVSLLGIATALGGCVNPPPKPNDPYYAPVLPRTPLPAAQNNGAIYQAGFEQNLYDDRKAFRVGDIITITLNEKTQASKKANSDIQKDSKTKMGLTSLFGSGMTTNNPIGGGDLSLSAEYGGSRDAKGDSQAGQSNSLTGSITVTVAEVLPNGILSVRGEKWMTLNTGNELVRIAGLV